MYIPCRSLCVCSHAWSASVPHSTVRSVWFLNSGLKTIIGRMLMSKETSHPPSLCLFLSSESLSTHWISRAFPYCLHLGLSLLWRRQICDGLQKPCHIKRRSEIPACNICGIKWVKGNKRWVRWWQLAEPELSFSKPFRKKIGYCQIGMRPPSYVKWIWYLSACQCSKQTSWIFPGIVTRMSLNVHCCLT